MRLPEPRLTLRYLLIGFALSLIGAAILFDPTLEFIAVDLIERVGLPLGPAGNFAVWAELALFCVSGFGLVALGIERVISRSR